MNKKQKLELTWIGKDEQPVLEPRILIEDPTKSYGDPHSENMLIHGDNLLALKALEQKFAGKIKCVYIDPPYNTGSAFAEYDDGLEHSIWLVMMRNRILLLRGLLSESGSLWIHLDDNEAHYCKVLLDEIFGRRQFVANLVWQKSYAVRSNAEFFSTSHEHILVYCKNRTKFCPNKFTRTDEQEERFSNPDNDSRGPWQSVALTISLVGGARGRQYAKTGKSDNIFEVTSPSGKKFLPPTGRCWSRNPMGFVALDQDKRIWWGHNGDRAPRLKMFLAETDGGMLPSTLWADGEMFGFNQDGVREVRELNVEGSFSTPKPEKLLAKVLEIASMPGDIVLDSFAGSGTTGAVAQKMGRRWIMVELNAHCDTVIVPRLLKVCDGTDQGGISKAVEWKGGGGFKYYDLAPSLLKKDTHGNYVISEEYNADMLAAAMAKQEGFTYAPSQECYWKQGFSTEQDFIFTTTNHVTQAMLDQIAEELAEGEHLLICCKKFSAGCDKRHPSIQVKKIPTMLMGRCEFGKEDYSLNIVNLTDEATAPAFVPQGPKDEPLEKAPPRTHGNKNPNQLELF